MSHSPIPAPTLAPAIVQAAAPQAPLNIPINLPATVTDVVFEGGQLLATIEVAGQTLTDVPLDLSIDFGDGNECPILHLEIPDGLHLDLLGLKVDTSGICLDIHAESGSGQLLGNLLCGITGLLDTGGLLDDLLGAITGPISLNDLFGTIGTIGGTLGVPQAQIDSLINGILDNVLGVLQPVLDASLDRVFGAPAVSNVAVGGTGTGSHGDCDILNLDLGPINLDLLGLVVNLDNCDGGPIELDITAEPGSGNLLGNLLCSLTHILDSNASANALAARLGKIGDVIGGLICPRSPAVLRHGLQTSGDHVAID